MKKDFMYMLYILVRFKHELLTSIVLAITIHFKHNMIYCSSHSLVQLSQTVKRDSEILLISIVITFHETQD